MLVLFDIGATYTRIAFSSIGDAFAEPIKYETPKDFSEGIIKLKALINEGLEGRKPISITGGVPGVLNSKKSKLLKAVNLSDWEQKPLYKELFMEFGVPVHLENDASLAGLGEAHHGVGRKFNIMAFLTLSTGIGGTRITDGYIDESAFGFEPGHHFISADSTFGDRASGEGILKKYGKSAEELNQKEWQEVTQNIITGLSNVTLLWSPEAIVLGGGITQNAYLDVKEIEIGIKRKLEFVFPKTPVIDKGMLGDTAGLFGAMVYSLQKRGGF